MLVLTAAATQVRAQDEAATPPLKFGYINSQEILASAPGAGAAQEAFESELAGFEAEAQELQQEIQRMQQQLESQRIALSAEAIRSREEQLRQKAMEAQQRMQELDQRAAQRREELVQPVMDEISDVIEAVRAEGGYAFIFDVAAGSIVAADPAFELTGEVLRRLEAAEAGGER
jgi:outer membrane protein